MPSSLAASTHLRSASTPARWPARRGRPRAFAQRPLPSMMIATCAGSDINPLSGVQPGKPSYLHDLGFFVRKREVDQVDGLVGHLLHAVGLDPQVVLADRLVLLGLLQVVHAVAADMARGDPRLLGILVRNLHQ